MWHLHRTIHESIVKNAIHTICYYLRIYYLLPNLSTKCLKMMKPGKVSLYHNWSLRCHKIYGYTYTPQNKSENRVLSGHHIQNHHKHLRSTFSQKAPSQMFDWLLNTPLHRYYVKSKTFWYFYHVWGSCHVRNQF